MFAFIFFFGSQLGIHKIYCSSKEDADKSLFHIPPVYHFCSIIITIL